MTAHNEDMIEKALREVNAYADRLGGESQAYWLFHQHRFRWMARLLQALMTGRPANFSLLDIGNSYQTLLFERLFPLAEIDTLGSLDGRYAPHRHSEHFAYDLNLAFDSDTWPKPGKAYELVTFLEVIEHLHVSPKHLLSMLFTYVQPNGLLIISTPNAARLSHRVHALLGRNPYEAIRENHHADPGHIREYTLRELTDYIGSSGFEIDRVYLRDLSGEQHRAFWRRIHRLLPGLRNEMILVLRKPCILPPREPVGSSGPQPVPG
jgi:trans-aconitate methyltransferase